jgi:hypothetical protein
MVQTNPKWYTNYVKNTIFFRVNMFELRITAVQTNSKGYTTI